jgi:pimeloyl-ACP methyl ester carboxylesterase
LAPGVRLIAVDRPGYGGSSDPPAGYSYARFAADLAALADALGVEGFAVAGHSSGGPYALAAAALLPGRVLACAAVSSDPPYSHPRCPDAVHRSDGMSADGKGGFYGRDPLAKVSAWRAKVLAAEAGAERKWPWRQGVLGFVTDFTLERIPWSAPSPDGAVVCAPPGCIVYFRSDDPLS